uniref:Tubulin-specific chaperone D C-terminal domain-containing protein n=1 Tax=Amphimedon queenslandica TaxID=400682 RepID=A0A1X7T4L7_AMPQE
MCLHVYVLAFCFYLMPTRYYIAEGVRLYSQETWRQVTMGKGTQLVENYIDKVVSFYIKESEASNHAVREAACTCIAELGNKISPDAVRPHVSALVTALLDCFHDESWPVRD